MGNRLATTVGSICALLVSALPVSIPNSANALFMDMGVTYLTTGRHYTPSFLF